jgi:osmotically-inducible protein OsmY
MRRSTLSERTRAFHPEDNQVRPLHLGPRAGARIGEYAPREPNEYSDDYYGPGDNYERRGFSDDVNPPRQYERGPRPGGVVLHGNVRPTAEPTDSGSYGRMHPGARSWASLQRHIERTDRERATPDHRGRGPKGYVRSDQRVHELICERLTDDPNIDASEVTIAVQDGEVTLTGTVDDRGTKYEIEEVVDSVHGVQDIHNQLHTMRPR